jgi:hypothetical protein
MHDALNHWANSGNIRAFAARDKPKDNSKNNECKVAANRDGIGDFVRPTRDHGFFQIFKNVIPISSQRITKTACPKMLSKTGSIKTEIVGNECRLPSICPKMFAANSQRSRPTPPAAQTIRER